jgi:HSP20 family protein
MSDDKALTQQNENANAKKAEVRALRPAVDIFENSTGITLVADMPGVTRERLNIRVDRDSLSIQGDTEIRMPEGMEALYADVQLTRFERSFSLSHELDIDKVEAGLKDGVLTLHIPRREVYQPRKIEVRTG